ncbi:hypothetical protein I7I51_08111 [Histoplasma capsulatum]|uniref:Uncharacterized protein n=1 Tax=Ajellomyces capsulatus TaxID=5037 RepID=A0A8A1M2M7_AJECA|nr:hypothetical protein I7I51_08111 [Histoplasma capsulatum]
MTTAQDISLIELIRQAALSAQRKRSERGITEARYGVNEELCGHQVSPVVYCSSYHGPDVPLDTPISQNTKRNNENSQHLRIHEQCGSNQSGSEVEIDFRRCTHEDEPCEPTQSYTHIHTGDRLLTLRIPYLGPVGWTVPARDGPQATKPFLIYQDPTAGYQSPPLPAEARKPVDEHVHLLASDDKENVAVDMDENEEVEDIPEQDVYVQDNMVAEAENIVELAAMNDGWNIWTLRNRPHEGEYGYEYGIAENDHRHGLDFQAGEGHRLQHNQQQGHQPEMEINVDVGGSLEASPVRSQRAHSNSIVIVSPPRRAGRLDGGDVANDSFVTWDGSPRAASLFF